MGNESPKLPDPRESLGKYQDFLSPKIQFSSHKIQFSSTAFRFLQQLSAFFNGFPIFFNGFLIFLNGFPLSEKSEKIYLRRQVYKRSLFELCTFCHLFPELHNSRYNAYISRNTKMFFCLPVFPMLRLLSQIGVQLYKKLLSKKLGRGWGL
jgi:hypothetical protein